MFIIFLKFGSNRSQAGQWMTEHNQWVQDGIDDGTFLMAGSLENAQGGVLLSGARNSTEIQTMIKQDPFVIHGVVTAEIHAVAPSRMSAGMTALLNGGTAIRVGS